MWIFNFIRLLPLILRCLSLINSEKYEEAIRICNNHLEKRPKDFIFYQLIIDSYYHMNDLKKCFFYFKKLLEVKQIKASLEKEYIDKIIGYKVNELEEYEIALSEINQIHDLIKHKESKISLLKYACVSYWNTEKYEEVINMCNSLIEIGFHDENIDNFLHESKKILNLKE